MIKPWTEEEWERERHRARLKWERDQTAYVDEAFELAYQEGFREGFQIGLIEAYEERLKLPITPFEQLRSCSLEELQKRVAVLEQQIRGGQV